MVFCVAFSVRKGPLGSPALMAMQQVRLVVIIGTEPDFGVSFAARLIQAAVRHVVVLLGGAARLKEDAPSYVTRE